MKKIVTILVAIALIAMMGTAAADPERIQIMDDGTSNLNTDNPIMIPNDGTTFNVDALFDLYFAGTENSGHTLTMTITPTDGNPLVAGEITISAIERDAGAVLGTATSVAGPSVALIYMWDQDNDGTGSINAPTDSDTLDISIVSNGPDNRPYLISFSDVGGSIGTNLYDTGLENRGISNVPEFPTIALPIAAILGLAFIFQRRREEE